MWVGVTSGFANEVHEFCLSRPALVVKRSLIQLEARHFYGGDTIGSDGLLPLGSDICKSCHTRHVFLTTLQGSRDDDA